MILNHLDERFSKVRVAILGDIMLDIHYKGDVNRISPEAPIPIVNVNSIDSKLGGAGNVASNIKSLGGICTLIGVIGDDESGEIIDCKLRQAEIINKVILKPSYKTTTKSRVVGNNQQITRLDFEEKLSLNDSDMASFKTIFSRVFPIQDVLIISDYDKGLFHGKLCALAIEMAQKYNLKIIVDPKGVNWDKYNGAHWITPNFKEFSCMIKNGIEHTNYDIEMYGRKIIEEYQIENLLVTRSQYGMTWISDNIVMHQETRAREVFDVNGAGDTVIATLAIALGAGFEKADAINLANYAGGISVGKFGTANVTVDELYLAYSRIGGSKNYTTETLAILVKDLQSKGKKVIFTNGCFDIIHRGHLMYLQEAKKLGDVLIVALNSDSSVKKLKGELRPINQESDRVFMMSQFSFIDYLVVFDDDTPERILSIIRPDVLVKGGDYTKETIIGKEYVKEVQIIPFIEGLSSTTLIDKIKSIQ